MSSNPAAMERPDLTLIFRYSSVRLLATTEAGEDMGLLTSVA